MLEDLGDQVFAHSQTLNSSRLLKDKEEAGASVYDQYNEASTSVKRRSKLHGPTGINPKDGSIKSRIMSLKNNELVRAKKVGSSVSSYSSLGFSVG